MEIAVIVQTTETVDTQALSAAVEAFLTEAGIKSYALAVEVD